MQVRFYIDKESERPHVENHGVWTFECLEVLEHPVQDFASKEGTRVALGPTKSGRVLKIVYRELDDEDGVLVITAYSLRGKELKAFRRRIRRGG